MISVETQQSNLLTEKLLKARQRALTPPPDLTLSEWTEEYFHLSPESSSLPGKFRFDRAPFQREVFDALSDTTNKKVVIMSSSQILKTQALLCYIGMIIHLDPAPILIVQPTSKMAQSFSKDRIDTMLRDVPILKGRVKDKRVRDSDNTIFHKSFPAGRLSIATSGSPSDLASRPIRYLLCDEIDRYAPGEEGDPITIARARTTTFHNAKEVLVSSPTDEGISRIAAEYQASDRRIYMVPCNECGTFQQLVWEQVKWEEKKPETAHYECQHCQAKWTDHQKNFNVQHGHWEATNPDSDVAGFHISNIYSSFKSLVDLASSFLLAKSDPEQLKAFINTQLAQTWKTQAQTVGDIKWLNRLENYSANTIPNGVGLLTAGVDTQLDRLECEITGWGVGDESWSVEYLIIHGNTNSPAPWEQLAQVLDKTYTRADGLQMRLNAMCIDAGGTAPQEVFAFSRRFQARNVYAIKGVGGEGKLIFPKSYKRWKGGQRFYPIGVDVAKDKLYNLIAINEHGPGYCHFPTDRDDDYFNGLTAETYTVKYKKGHPYKVWEKKQGVRNEPLDCRVYSMAARFSFAFDMKKRMETLTKKALEVVKVAPVVEPVVKVALPNEKPQTLQKPIRQRIPRTGGMRDFISNL
jgi:phage terminase large subunit GpA-like protein